MEDYYEYLDSNGVTTLYKLIKDDTVALIDSYSVTINGITTTLDTHINDSDIHTPISDIESMVDTKISGLVNSAPETLDTLKELADALGNDSNFATTVVNQIGSKASKDDVYTKQETDTLLEDKANSVHTHVVSDITDFPTIPTKISELSNDSNFVTSTELHDYATKNDLNSKQDVLSEEQLSNIDSIPDKANKSDLSTVATSGSYKDLLDKPVIPEGADLSDYYNKGETDNLLNSKANTSDLAIVAKSGNYSDLINTPTIPTKVSDLTNDSGYITGVAWGDITSKPSFSDIAISGSYNDLVDTPTIPTKVSQLENDMGFGTGGDTSDCVHKTGDEYINGYKIFSNTIHRYADLTTSGGEQVYAFTDTNANSCGHIYNNAHWAVDTIINSVGAYNEKSGKLMEIGITSNDAGVGIAYIEGSATNGNLESVTSITEHNGIATMGWVNNPATSTNVVHRSGDENIAGNKLFGDKIICTRFTHSVNYGSVYITGGSEWDKGATLVLHGEESNDAGTFIINSRDKTRSLYLVGRPDGTLQWAGQDIATTAWVRNYVNSVGGNNTVGPSVSAYWSNNSNVTATGQAAAHANGIYPACYSEYITKTPTVGTMYSGAQLYTVLNTYASATGNSIGRITNVTAQATFSNPISPTGKYLCTTANTVRFRAYVSQGTTSGVGTASVVDNSSAKSIFTRIE